MSEFDVEMLFKAFDRLDRECDTPEKAAAQMKAEGLLDADGQLAPQYREPIEDAICR